MKNIAVIGAGTMGNGIAHTFAQSGFKVNLIDISEAVRESEELHELPFASIDELKQLITALDHQSKCIPIFVKVESDKILILPKDIDQIDLPTDQEYRLVYIGKPLKISSLGKEIME